MAEGEAVHAIGRRAPDMVAKRMDCGPGGTDTMLHSWALVIATYNRGAILSDAVRLAVAQTPPPIEAIIVDASPDWEANRDRVTPIAADAGVPLKYQPARERSLPVQRNQGIAQATADILVMIDDDSFLFPDSIPELLAVYGADANGEVAAVGLRGVEKNPLGAAPALARKATGHSDAARTLRNPALKRLVRWFYVKVLMMAHEETFIAYDTEHFRTPALPQGFSMSPVRAVNSIPGYAMTVRRTVAEREPFDEALKYYAALEDADASHRFRRHGALLVAIQARVHHYRTSAGRLPRDKVIILQLLNLALFLRRNSSLKDVKRRQFRIMIWRRLLAEALKDLFALRLSFPQVRGVIHVMRNWTAVFDVPEETLFKWYPEFQRRLVEEDTYIIRPEITDPIL